LTARVGAELFHASGLMVLERNFLDVYPYQRWNGKQLPAFVVGQSFVPAELVLHRGDTMPPQLLAEHDLIELMNSNGIGTDATIPEHIFKVQEREWVPAVFPFLCNTAMSVLLMNDWFAVTW
jgi:DNA topoisomerase-3